MYSAELANLTTEIDIKQKLIAELEKSNKRMQGMKQHYEDKFQQLQARIRNTEEERDKVLSSLSKFLIFNQSKQLIWKFCQSEVQVDNYIVIKARGVLIK